MKQARLFRIPPRFSLPRAAVFALLLLASICSLRAADRVALVIGNSRYDNLPEGLQLASPAVDAADVAAQLKALGYTIITGGAVVNAPRQTMIRATETFAAKAAGAEAAVFYYSGHGIQIGEENFLMARDTPAVTSFTTLRNNNVNLRESVMSALEEAGAQTKVIILDCCRDNPFATQLDRALNQLGKSVKTKSLGDISGYGSGFYLAFATGPGKEALDGNGARNSPFTAAMLKTLPGSASKDIDFFFRDVKKLLGKDQISWTNHSLSGDFSLASLTKPAFEPGRPVFPSVPATPPQKRDAVTTATKETPYINSLGQEFVPAGTRGVLFCKWDTRVSDYREFVNATNRNMSGGIYVLKVKGTAKAGYSTAWELDTTANWNNPGFQQSDAHPVVGVSLEDGRAFCEWLTEKERTAGLLPAGAAYRLPRDEEWSAAVGSEKYPWENTWPPKEKVGNYADSSFAAKLPGKGWNVVPGLEDGWARTSPVGTYKANQYGLFDMGGNVWQWCDTDYKASMNSAETIKVIPTLKEEKASDGTPYRVLRGASWSDGLEINLRSTCRFNSHPKGRDDFNGFRCVLVISGG